MPVASESESFAALLQRARQAAGLTQRALAERARIGLSTVRALEQGVSAAPQPETLSRLADALDLPPTERSALIAAFSAVRIAQLEALVPPPSPHLPVPKSSFVGREHELSRVCALLEQSRLVSLIGVGGVGKSRLALAAASSQQARYPDGVWLLELAALRDGNLLPGALARLLGLKEEPGIPLYKTLASALRPRQLLLVLDNCEHLQPACAALLTPLLWAAPNLRVLATSRQPLLVGDHERRYRVPSLAAPDPRQLPPLEEVAQYPAVQLFVQRAQARDAAFCLSEANAQPVVEICTRLDGVPLAIELAAAQVDRLPLAGLVAGLDDRFRLLTGGPRRAPSRQRTLRATLDWSWALLTPTEQTLLARVSVFSGGFIASAAESVWLGPVPHGDILGPLLRLEARSMLQPGDGCHKPPRLTMLETVRQYGAARLAERGETAQVRDKHLAWCIWLAEQAESALKGPEQAAWLARLDVEHDNLRAALTWALEQGATEEGLRLAGALCPFWYMRGYFGEGQRWLERALASGKGASVAARAKALNGTGALANRAGEHGRAAALFEETLLLRHELGDRQGIAGSLSNLGMAAYWQADYKRAAALYEDALAMYRELENWWGVANNLLNLGAVAYWQAEYVQATALYDEALALKRKLGDARGTALTLNNLARMLYWQGDHIRAEALHVEGLALMRKLGDRRGTADSVLNLSQLACQQGDHCRAATLVREGLRLIREIGARDVMGEALWSTALVAAALGQLEPAGRLAGAAETLRELLGTSVPPGEQADHEALLLAMRVALGEDLFAAAWAEGRALSADEAVDLALALELPTQAPSSPA